MKPILRFSILAVSLLMFTPGLQAKKKPDKQAQLQAMQVQIDAITQDMQLLDLKINRMTVEKFLEMAERGTPIPIFAIKTIDFDKLYDTVPHLNRAHNAFELANTELRHILEKDDEYNEAVSIQRTKANPDEWNRRKGAIFSRLSQQSQEYKLARITRDSALKEQNIAILRFLLEDYQARGLILPTNDLIKQNEQTAINGSPQIRNLTSDKLYMVLALADLKKEYTKLKYAPE